MRTEWALLAIGKHPAAELSGFRILPLPPDLMIRARHAQCLFEISYRTRNYKPV